MSRRHSRDRDELPADVEDPIGIVPDWWSDDYAPETLAVCEQVTRWALASNRIPSNRNIAVDLAEAVIVEALEFRPRFIHGDADNLPKAWYATLTTWLKGFTNYWLRAHGDPDNKRGRAYTSASVEERHETVGDAWVGAGRESLRIHSFDLMGPEPRYLLLESIAERIDPRLGAYKASTLCTEYGCRGRREAHGLCHNHYQQDRHNWTGTRRTESKEETPCSEPGCTELVGTKGFSGLCKVHHERMLDARAPRCTADGCDRPGRTRGMCAAHYQQARKENAAPCIVQDCDKPGVTSGLCPAHYQRLRNTGTTDAPKPRGRVMTGGTCVEDGCQKRAHSRQRCHAHYKMLRAAEKEAENATR